jgi:hypothetical protein
MASHAREYLIYDPNELADGQGHSFRLGRSVLRDISSILHGSPTTREFYVTGQAGDAGGTPVMERYEIYDMGNRLVGAADLEWDEGYAYVSRFGTCNNRTGNDRDRAREILAKLQVEPLIPGKSLIPGLGKLFFCVMMADLAACGTKVCAINPLNEKVKRFYCRLLEMFPDDIVSDHEIEEQNTICIRFPTRNVAQVRGTPIAPVWQQMAMARPKYSK